MRRIARGSFPALAATFCVAAIAAEPVAAQQIARSARSAAPADNGNWEMPGKNYASTRFSAMRQITPANVARLQTVFSLPTGINKGHEAPPLVVGSTMYFVTPFPNNVYAIDLAARPKVKVKWVFRPKPVRAAQGVACCDAGSGSAGAVTIIAGGSGGGSAWITGSGR